MNRKITLFFVGCLLMSSSVFAQKHKLGKFLLEQPAAESNKDNSKAKMMSIQDALQWRYRGLADENGEVKPNYHINANIQADMMRNTSNSQRSANLQWEELGPSNIGGRTRSILVDKRDPARATIYAGSVGGGLWKSTNHGDNWTRVRSVSSCLAISCITQGPDNTIYFGTGEGLPGPDGTSRNSGAVGNGLHFLYGNDQDSIIPSTYQSLVSNSAVWSEVNRVAVNPTNAGEIFAATAGAGFSSGLLRSMDTGRTWVLIGSTAAPISGLRTGYQQAADVKYSADGSTVYASVSTSGAGTGSKLILSQDGGSTFALVPNNNLPGVTTPVGRIEIAIAPSDASVAYLNIATSGGDYGGTFKTSDFGTTWTLIGSPGPLLQPFGSNHQGYYDNIIAVNSKDADKVYVGGTQIYTYSSLIGWNLATIYFGTYSDPTYVHPDMHAIVFSDKDSNEMFVGCDGGLYRSNNAYNSFPNPTFSAKNRDYAVTENYSVAADQYGSVVGGAQDNGTNYVDFANGGLTYGTSVYSGDGVYAEISHFDPNIFVGGYVYGDVHRSNNKGGNWGDVYDPIIDPTGPTGSGNVSPSRCGQSQNADFVSAFWLEETKKATNTVSKAMYIADVPHSAGDIVNILSHTRQSFTDSLPRAVHAGDTVYFTDRYQSRLYLASACGIWMTPDVLDFTNTPRWFKIYSSGTFAFSLTSTVTGDTIYVGENSKVTRVTGINSVLFDTFSVGRFNLLTNGTHAAMPTNSVIVVPASSTGAGSQIQGIDVDKSNPNHVLCAIAGYKSSRGSHVYESTDAGQTWTSVGDSLPNMPVYQCVIDAYNSSHFIVGTELGVWDSYDGGATWTEQNAGMDARVPVYRLRQQKYLDDNCYALYIGTHGRGMWRSTTITSAQGCSVYALGINDPKIVSQVSNMIVYPNPMGNNNGKVQLELSKASDATIRVIDMPGRILQEGSYHNLKEGKNELDLSTSNLANGTYLVVCTLTNGETFARTIVVSK